MLGIRHGYSQVERIAVFAFNLATRLDKVDFWRRDENLAAVVRPGGLVANVKRQQNRRRGEVAGE